MSQAINPKLIGAANEFVNIVYYGTMMREFRRSQGEGLFGNTPGGKIFMEQLDAELIKRIGSNRRVSPLAKVLVERFSGKGTAMGALNGKVEAGRKIFNNG